MKNFITSGRGLSLFLGVPCVAFNVYVGNPKIAGMLSLLYAFILWIDGKLQNIDDELSYQEAKLDEAKEDNHKIRAFSFVVDMASRGIKEPDNMIRLAKEHKLDPKVIHYVKLIVTYKDLEDTIES